MKAPPLIPPPIPPQTYGLGTGWTGQWSGSMAAMSPADFVETLHLVVVQPTDISITRRMAISNTRQFHDARHSRSRDNLMMMGFPLLQSP